MDADRSLLARVLWAEAQVAPQSLREMQQLQVTPTRCWTRASRKEFGQTMVAHGLDEASCPI